MNHDTHEKDNLPDQDRDLVDRIIKGHGRSFVELVKRYESRLYNFGLRMCRDPQDAECLDNELDDVQCDEIRQRIEGCVKCKLCLETLKRAVDLCGRVTSQPVPEEFSDRLAEVMKELWTT